MRYRTATIEDLDRILKLYQVVARTEGGIARREDEITQEYIANVLEKSLSNGLIIVGENPDDENELIAEIHAYKAGIQVFDHVLGDLTLVVRPDFQRKKLGRTILTIFLDEVAKNRPDVGKVELIARESNGRAIALYQSLGFQIEGRLEMRIRTPDHHYEADIPMGWQNPNFEF
jgi:ribosomal protein S18 acetylase RimI-like enzyme